MTDLYTLGKAMRDGLLEARRTILELKNARWSEAEGSDAEWVGGIDSLVAAFDKALAVHAAELSAYEHESARHVIEPAPVAQGEYDGLIANLTKIADASRRDDGSDIPLGQQVRQAANALAALQARADTAERNLGNILARIHRDGGHYQEQHGTLKACVDADLIVSNLMRDVEAAQARIAELEGALPTVARRAVREAFNGLKPFGPVVWSDIVATEVENAIRAAVAKGGE